MKLKIALFLLSAQVALGQGTITVGSGGVTNPDFTTLKLTTSPRLVITKGSGSPETVVSAAPGSLYMDTTGKSWVKATGTAATGWTQLATGGAGAVTSVFTRTGNVVAAANDYTFAQIGSKPTTLAGYGITDAQPLDSDLTAIAALTTTSFGRGSLALADAAAFRTYIGAGTSNFDGTWTSLTGTPTTLSGYGITDAQPLDAQLTSLAGLTYPGKTLQVVRVNAGESGFEFAPVGIPAGGTTGQSLTKTSNTDYAVGWTTGGAFDPTIDSLFTAAQTITVSDAATNVVTDVLNLRHNSTGTAATSFGTGMLFNGEDSTTNNTTMGEVSFIWTDATHASRKSALVLKPANASGLSTVPLRFYQSGYLSNGTFTDLGSAAFNSVGGYLVNDVIPAAGRFLISDGATHKNSAYKLPTAIGTNTFVLTSNGTDVIWAAGGGGGGGTPGGANTQVQFNDSGVFGGDTGLVWDKTADTLTITQTPGANTIANGLALKNGTAATSGNQQHSPSYTLQGNVWSSGAGGANKTTDYRAYLQGIQSTSGTAKLVQSIGLNGALIDFMTTWNTGGVSFGGAIDPGGGGVDITGRFTLSGTITPPALSGDVNDYNPTGQTTAVTLRVDGGVADRSITGLANGTDGRILTIINIGTTNKLNLTIEDAGSTTTNRITAPGTISLDPNTQIALRYDGTTARWRPLSRALANTGVTAGSYTNTNLTVDAQGRITTASNGSAGSVSDAAYGASWDAITGVAPSKNAVYDWGHTFDTDDNGKVNVLDIAAGIVKTDAGGVVSVATEGTDYLNSARISNTVYASSWDAVTAIAPSKNAIYDWGHTFDTDDDGKVNVLDLGAGIPKTDSSGVLSLAMPGTDYLDSSYISDTAYASSWDTVTAIAPSKNAIYDWGHTFDTDDDGKVNVLDIAAGIVKTDASGVVSVATEGTDYLNSARISDTAFASSWNGVTGVAPSKNAVYDWGHTFDTNDNGKVNVLDTGAGIVLSDSGGVTSALSAGTAGQHVASDGTTFVMSNDSTRSNMLSAMRALGSTILAETVGVSGTQLTSAPSALSDGTIYVMGVYLPVAATITGVKWWQAVSGSYTADNNNVVGLYTYSGGTLTQVAVSTNDGTMWQGTANSVQSKAFSATYAASPGLYFVMLLYNNSAQTTAPTIGRGDPLNNASMAGLDYTNSAKMYGTITFPNANLPAPTQAMSGVSNTITNLWVALY